ncbi:MAG TPA: glycosyltransferase [Myxococcaceae bacterium]|jgi:glycosyltransferase involved in cell wall biosynthesis
MSASSPQSQTATPDLHVVVPVYNEAENFRPFYESLASKVRTPFDVLVVYDRDEDTTLPVAREIAAKDPRVQLVKNEFKGVLGALKTGMRHPKSGAVLVTMADLSDDHSCVDAMYSLYQQGFAVVSASRYARGGAQRGGPKVKGLLSRTAGASLRLLAGVPTWDATNNFKLYSREFLGTVDIESQGGFELALELTVKAHLQGRRIAELPTVWTDRVAGKSNFKLMKWLPHYLRWYTLGMRGRLTSLRSR